MISKGLAAAGVAGALLLGYCIYFDKQRRSDPNFKKKLRERRRKLEGNTNKKGGSAAGQTKWPNLKDQEAVQKFFINEIQLGEELLSMGEMEQGVEHLSRAVAVCGQPQQLLEVLNQTLPPQVFQILLQKLPSVGESILSASGSDTISEDDLE